MNKKQLELLPISAKSFLFNKRLIATRDALQGYLAAHLADSHWLVYCDVE
jgi:hypothetical protein